MPYQDLTETLSVTQRAKVLELLKPGEELLWIGHPHPARQMRRLWTSSAIGLLWIGLVTWIFFFNSAPEARSELAAESASRLLCIPFLLVGALFIVMPLRRLKASRNTLYLVSEKQAAIYDGKHMRSIPLQSGLRTDVREHREGGGDLIFDLPSGTVPKSDTANDHPKRFRAGRFGFFGIPAVREVENLVKEQL